MSIQNDQNLVIRPKEKKETETWSFVQKKGQNRATTKHTYKCVRMRLKHSHHKRSEHKSYKSQSRRMSRNDPPRPDLGTTPPVDIMAS